MPGPPVTNANVKAGHGFIPNGVEEKNLYYYHPDHLGSSSYITDKNGEVIQHTEYIAFGEILVDEHSTTNKMPYLFNGKELDYETGLYYYGARYYDPKVSIFLNVDPLVEKTGTPYAYTYNNPIRYIDPTGMEPERIFNVKMNDGSVVQREINDGVNEIVNIDEFHFNWLQDTYNKATTINNGDGTTSLDLSKYNEYYSQLAIGTKGYDIAMSARNLVDSKDYAFDVKKGDFPAGTDKCNKFVYDRLLEYKAIDKYPAGAPPTAGKYANPKFKINGLDPINLSIDKPRLGDIIAGAHNYAGSTASGHVEIITHIVPDGRFWTTGATDTTVQTRTKGYDMLNGKTFQDRAGKFKYSPVTIRRPK